MVIGATSYPIGPGDSLPGHFTASGSGFAVPAGLEAALEFNGLYMNVQGVPDRYRILNIDGLMDADIRDSRDSNTDDDGETPYNSLLGGRTIVISGTIDTYSVAKLRDMQMALRAAFADRSVEHQLIFRLGDYTKDHYINCKKIAPINGVEQQANLKAARDFQVSLRASNPRFLSYYPNFFTATPALTTITPILLGTLINNGNYWAEPVYKIFGPSNSTTLLNETVGTSFTVTSIPASDYFIFDVAKKSLKNSDGTNKWNNFTDDSDYLKLQGSSRVNPTGANEIFFLGDSPRIEITWKHSWV